MTTDPLSYHGPCTWCGAPHGLAAQVAGQPGFLCPTCANDIAIWDRSREHLEMLVIPVLEAWLETWEGNRAFLADPLGMAGMLSELQEVGQRVLASRRSPRRRRM